MAFAPSPRHTLANPSQNPSPLSPLSPAHSISPLPLSDSQKLTRPGGPSRRKSSGQTIQTIGNKRNKSYSSQHQHAASTMSGPAGRRSNPQSSFGPPTGVTGKDGQWATMDPDEVFRRLNVKEVRKVESLLRASAAGKQGELRNMVSERYRDLLLSTSQISQLRDSSLRLSTTLKHIEGLCSSPRVVGPQKYGDNQKASAEIKKRDTDTSAKLKLAINGDKETDIKNQLPVAASVKLLLDVPEALYSYLAGKQFLEAAYLWLLTRVVKEGLVNPSDNSMGDKDSGHQTFLPLVQKQWEILVPLRGQIVERATISLRDLADGTSAPKEVQTALAHALLAILLLEAHNNPLQDILDLFLAQRTKALHDINAEAVQAGTRMAAVGFTFGRSTERTVRSPITPRSSLPEQSGRKNRHSRKDSRLNAAEVLRSLSPAPRRMERSSSASSAQNDDSAIRKAKAKERRRLSEQARAGKTFEDSLKLLWETVVTARAVIISADGESLLETMMRRVQTSTTSTNGEGSQEESVTTASLLRAMPSSQILQAYLPNSIKNFSPFIGSVGQGVDKSALGGLLDTWFKTSLERLEAQAKGWLGGLDSITEVWQVKRQASTALETLQSMQGASLSPTEAKSLVDAMTSAFIDRAQTIWQGRLEATAGALEEGLQDDIEALMQGNNDVAQDLHPSLSFFAPIAFPDHRSVSSSFASTELPAFTATLKKRLQSRTPILDKRLAELERMAADIRSDLRSLKENEKDAALIEQYRQAATKTAKDMVGMLSGALETARTRSPNKTERASTCLFIGRLALALMTQSRALPILLLGKKAIQGVVASALDAVYIASLVEWKERTVQDGLEVFAEAMSSSVPETRATDFGNGLIFALQDMATALFDSGLPIEYRSAATEDLCKGFGTKAIQLVKEKQMPCPEDQRLLLEAIASGTQEGLPKHVRNDLRKTQLLLYPATSYIRVDTEKPSDTRFADLLPLGIPNANHEYISPVPIVKPSARFSMLSIV